MISIAGRRPVPAKAILRCLFADEGGVSTLLLGLGVISSREVPLSLHFPSLSHFRINFSRRVDCESVMSVSATNLRRF